MDWRRTGDLPLFDSVMVQFTDTPGWRIYASLGLNVLSNESDACILIPNYYEVHCNITRIMGYQIKFRLP